jgi:hypothetical protein
MTTDPSPTDEVTRFTEPARTSPTAKMPNPRKKELAEGKVPICLWEIPFIEYSEYEKVDAAIVETALPAPVSASE